MKKLLTLFVVVCMLLSAIPLVASADNNVAKPESNQIPQAPTATIDENTIYVSSNGDDANDGTKEKPIKTLNRAYKQALLNAKANVSNIATIYVKNNVDLCDDASGKLGVKEATDLPTQDCTVYIFGQESGGSYPTVTGSGKNNWMTLGTDTVIYDLNFANKLTGGLFIISAAFHKLTIGNHFSATNGVITGGMWSNLFIATLKNNANT